ncbi:hypothetical protein OPKNFCMD_4709 [Methylobacterium crusticola]|uniref:Uncharacterized protein n=1 Tax=Methylobacterium crusticola TaxID=1697972 RepID=A0ABQ4R4A6_9HYPH|nr:hypothetical protein OPKNFCMD_4709 [Methylobacterium crusticola]
MNRLHRPLHVPASLPGIAATILSVRMALAGAGGLGLGLIALALLVLLVSQ